MTWLPNFKERAIIIGRNIDIEFLKKYRRKMMELVETQVWEGMMPLPKDVYSTLVRLFYCNLEVRTLENDDFTIDTRVRAKNIVLTLSILSKIIGVPNAGIAYL